MLRLTGPLVGALIAGGAMAEETGTAPSHGGASHASISARIEGGASIRYRIGAEAGQRLTISLDASDARTRFSVHMPGAAPGDPELAAGTSRFEDVLPVSGEYSVTVDLEGPGVGADASSAYALDIALTAPDLDAPVMADFADGLQGGPDRWEVRADRVNLRAEPWTSAPILGTIGNGDVLQNRGCRMAEGRRWCRVASTGDEVLFGWVAGDFLVEYVGP